MRENENMELRTNLRLRKLSRVTTPTDGNSEKQFSCNVVLSKLHFLAYLGLVTGFVSISIPFALAVYRGDVSAWLPYISDAGGDPPQSALFSLGMCLIAMMFTAGGYLLYLIIEAQNKSNCNYVSRLAKSLFVAGFLMAIGLIVVATNPTGHLRRDGGWVVPVLLPHIIGAVVFFCAGFSMMALNTLANYLVQRPNGFNFGFICRSILMAATLIGGIFVFYGIPPLSSIEIMKPSPHHERKYPPNATLSAFGEWVVVVTFMLFVATFIPDFSRTKLTIVVDYK